MEQYYYNHMDKQKQAAYHGILQGITSLVDEFQIPALDLLLRTPLNLSQKQSLRSMFPNLSLRSGFWSQQGFSFGTSSLTFDCGVS